MPRSEFAALYVKCLLTLKEIIQLFSRWLTVFPPAITVLVAQNHHQKLKWSVVLLCYFESLVQHNYLDSFKVWRPPTFGMWECHIYKLHIRDSEFVGLILRSEILDIYLAYLFPYLFVYLIIYLHLHAPVDSHYLLKILCFLKSTTIFPSSEKSLSIFMWVYLQILLFY